MTPKTFERGAFISHYKEFTEHKPITTIPLPDEVVIPLHQHTGAPCSAMVEVGDKVKTGQKIGSSDAFVSAPIFSSVDGEVIAIEPRPYFTGTNVNAVVIKVAPEQEEPQWKDNDISKVSADQIKEYIKEAGIVGMGGAAFPTHVKLSPPRSIDAVIINACECEPFLTCDHRNMLEMPEALIEGTKLIAKTVGAPMIYYGIETNKGDAMEVIRNRISREKNMEVVELDVKYPQGAEKQLIKAVMDREVPPGKLPFDVGVVVQNVATAIAVYEAVRYEKPLYERVLTVSGDGIARPGNIKARIGTCIDHIIEQCGGIKAMGQAKVIMGGPMTGWAQTRLDIPITKGSSGILVFGTEMIAETEHEACVRCGKCVDHCPMGLYPNYIGTYAETGRYELAEEWGAIDCFECGVCVYVCPSNRPIVQFVRETKQYLAAKKK
ncbi:MAG: electron transport complex subunit RsxC [Firmicutes bacterium]|nr:electron transport complex subunit RsxC [Bacillota bacterium]